MDLSEFQLTVDISVSMATQSSNLKGQKSGAMIQMKDQTLTPKMAEMAQKRQKDHVAPHHSPQ